MTGLTRIGGMYLEVFGSIVMFESTVIQIDRGRLVSLFIPTPDLVMFLQRNDLDDDDDDDGTMIMTMTKPRSINDDTTYQRPSSLQM